MLAVGVPDRPPQRLLHRPLQDAGLHGDAGHADVLLVGRRSGSPRAQNIVNLPAEFSRLGSGDLVSFYFGEKADAEIKRRDILPFVTYPMLIALALAHRRAAPAAAARSSAATSTPSATTPKAAEISGVPVRRVIIARLRHLRASAPRSPRSSIPPGSAAAGRPSAPARRCSTSSARR